MIFRFFRNATFNIVAEFSNRISNAIIFILISKYLTVSQFGSYSLAMTYFTLGMLFSFWGFGNLLTREVAKEPSKFDKFFTNFLIMRFIFNIFAFLLIFVIASLMNYSRETMVVIMIVFIGVFAESFKNLVYSVFNAREETHYVSIVFLFSSVLKLIFSYILLRNDNGIIGLAWVNTIVNYLGVVGLVILMKIYLPPIKINFDWEFTREQTKLAMPLFLIAIFSIAESRLDILLLSGFYKEEIVGFYSAALVLQSGLLIFPEGIRNAIFPILSRSSIKNPIYASKIYSPLFKYITLVSMAITTGSVVLASKLILTIYDNNFLDSVNIFRVLMFSYPFFSIAMLNIRLLNAYNKDSIIVMYYLIDLLITVILSLIIMPIYGGLGAAYIKVLTTGILYFLFLIQIYKLLPKLKISGILIRGIIASSILYTVLIFLRDMNLLLNIMVGFIIFTVSLALMNTFGKEEIFYLKSILNHRTHLI